MSYSCAESSRRGWSLVFPLFIAVVATAWGGPASAEVAGDLMLRTAPDPGASGGAEAEVVAVDATLLAAAPQTLWLELEAGLPELVHRTAFEVVGDTAVWRGSFADDPPGYSSVTISLVGDLVVGTFQRLGRATYLLRPRGPGRGVLLRVAPGSGLEEISAWRRAASEASPGEAPLPPGSAPSTDPPSVTARASATVMIDMLFIVTPLAQADGATLSQAQHSVDVLNTVLANSSVPGRVRIAGLVVEDLDLEGSATLSQLLQRSMDHPRAQQLQNEHMADLVTVLFKSPEETLGCGVANPLPSNATNANHGSRAYIAMASWCLPSAGVSGNVISEYAMAMGANRNPEIATDPRLIPYARAHVVEGEFRTMMAYATAECDCPPVLHQLSDPRATIRGVPAGIVDERDNARAIWENLALVASFRGAQQAQPPGPKPPVVPPPVAPSGLTAAAQSATEVVLGWSDNADDETGYQVHRRAMGGSWAKVADLPADSTGHTVTGLEPGVTYDFRVRAVSPAGKSAYSNIASATTPKTPAAPAGLAAEPASSTAILLSWEEVEGATSYEVRLRTADPAADAVAPLVFAAGGSAVGDLTPSTPYTFHVRAVNAQGPSPWSVPVSATTYGAAGALAPCDAGGSSLCLLDGRFEVRTRWRNPREPFNHGDGSARAIVDSKRSGLFTFFNLDNVELVVKMLDGRPVNQAFWVFYGALSDVEYWVSVRDTETGELMTYRNPPEEICGRGDTTAFVEEVPAEAGAVATLAGPLPGLAADGLQTVAAAEGSCVPGPEALCLTDGRFRVEVDWTNPRVEGDQGTGKVFDGIGTDLSGYFWFFREDNLELAVKILDGRSINGHFWIFWGGLTDVGYTLRVTDTVTDVVHEFENPPLTLCGGAETGVL